jgi:hypothetical protein
MLRKNINNKHVLTTILTSLKNWSTRLNSKSSSESEVNRPASADAILSSGKQIIVSLGHVHVGACTLKHERSEP